MEELSRSRPVLWVFFGLFIVVGGYLTIQLFLIDGVFNDSLWRLLREEPMMRLAMFDFFLLAGWVWLWMMDDAKRAGRFVWGWLPFFCLFPSGALLLYLLTGRKRRS